ncbi:MAG TPA: hypothetical protein VLK23_14645 [Thermodesulfobacteriota bacterium]|nr:hypothetical protein [Thermodesulfobacteriota bacterium]
MRYVRVWILAVMIMVSAAPGYPHSQDQWREEVSIEVLSRSGSTFLVIPHQDFWKEGTHILKKYLEARKGENYGIVIRNRTPDRVGVVIAVDGRNIISGKKSNLSNNEEMYLVNGYGYARYDGWRTDRDTVHKFYFTDRADSYAVRTFGDSTSMGVIAVAVYRERERPKPQYENRRNAPAAPSAENSARSKLGGTRDEAAGTGFGDPQYSPVIRVAFEPEPNPIQKILVKYEWREVLCRKEILNCLQEPGNRLWDEDAYAPYPPGYPRN